MASFTYSHSSYCHNGPRQGVYPLQQLEQYRTVSWRVCQLKHPKSSYRNKTRTESPVILPGPPPLPQRSANIYTKKMQPKQDNQTSTKGSTSGYQFMVTTAPMTIQPRPPQKEKSTPPVSKGPPHSPVGYPYPDPLQINGDPLFEDRLSEIAQHETNTVKQEEWQKRKRQSSVSSNGKNFKSTSVKSSRSSTSLSRPTSARGMSAITTSIKVRKASVPSSSDHPKSVATKTQNIHTTSSNIHKSKSAIELKTNDKLTSTENLPPKTPRSFLPEKEKADQERVVIDNSVKSPNTSPSKLLTVEGVSSDSDDSKGDNLNVTSDLGLSLDSLPLSGEENELLLDTQETACTEKQSRNSPVSFDIPNTPPRKRKQSKNKKPRL